MKLTHLWLPLIMLISLTGCLTEPAALANNRGNEAYQEGEYQEALENYADAQRENPEMAEPFYNAGGALYEQENLDSAKSQLEQALRLADDELAQKGHYNLGNTYFQQEEWESAIEAYEEALRLDPNDQDAKNNLELALKELQQQQQQQQQQQGQQGQQPQEGDQPQGEQPQQGQQPGDQPQEGGQNGDQEQDGQQGDQPGENEGQGGGEDENEQEGGGQGDEEQDPNSDGELSQEEAEQLLDALGQESQTLQERLQQGFQAEGRPPSQDW